MNKKQFDHLIWFLKFIGIGFMMPFAQISLKIITGDNFDHRPCYIVSTVLLIWGIIGLYIIGIMYKEEGKKNDK